MPEACENCQYMKMHDRLEDFGDVVEPRCERLKCWLDFYEDEPAPCTRDGKNVG